MAQSESKVRFIQANFDDYQAGVAKLKPKYIRYPRVVSIETQVKCNAKCGFCPYPVSPRQGQEMSSDLFLKIINDLTAIPREHSFKITLCRINEPLLDKRLRYFHEVIAEKLPSSVPGFWSNGTMLRKGAFEWMSDHKGATLTISLNSVDEDEHRRLMGFGLKRVLPNLDYLHELVVAGKFLSTVILVAPFESDEQATKIDSYCSRRWPRFVVGIRPFFEWQGGSERGKVDRAASSSMVEKTQHAINFSCAQWYDLHILANGVVTKCCIDETGFEGNERFDSNRRHVLEIYGASASLRENLPDRSSVNGCETCFHLG